jgi:hypothetical protein
MDVGEVVGDEILGHVADVQPDEIQTVALDLGIDGAGHDVARGQFQPLVIIGHEALAGPRIDQPPALAAHRLGDEEVLDLQIVEAGRVELHHFHVAHPAPARQAMAMPSPVAPRGAVEY